MLRIHRVLRVKVLDLLIVSLSHPTIRPSDRDSLQQQENAQSIQETAAVERAFIVHTAKIGTASGCPNASANAR